MNATTGEVVRLTHDAVASFEGASARLLWLVNICWSGCGFCQSLEPDWQRLARRMRHEVAVTFWDAGLMADIPEAIGRTNTTPAIRAIIPSSVQGAEPRRVTYHGSRQLHDLLRFAAANMPNEVARM